jgi:cell fate regulator YaaT (PSP1 superfamily)
MILPSNILRAGRHDFFFLDDSSMSVRVGDLAIVEADRGKDLGRVVRDDILNTKQLEEFQARNVDMIVDSQFPKEVVPKRLFRLASPSEVSMLASKMDDESKALSICQSKIRQKKLPMEVVDLEYQWYVALI